MAENKRFGREPIQVVQIDQDFCNLTYGDAPCQAETRQNYLKWSEDLNSGGPSSVYWNLFDIGSISPGDIVDGVQLQSFSTEGASPSFGEIQLSRFNFGSVGGYKAYSFTFYIKKSLANFRITVGTFLDSGASYDDSVTFNADDGSLVAADPDVDTVFLEYTSESIGTDYYRIKVSVNLNSSIIENRSYQLAILPQSSGTYQIGGFQFTSGAEFQDYFKTEGEIAEIAAPAGEQKCFNTRSTCQDPENYDRGVLPLNFVDKRSPLPKDDYYIPSVTSVSVTPAKLNPGGADRNAGALGQRASLSIRFMDHPHNDRMVDKYRAERDYDPKERGTFWTKWRARNPYYMQRPITLRSGYLKDGNIVDEITRQFVITGFSGPDANGNVSIQGKDVLTLAEDEKAQAPVASRGKLAADITAGATSATLTPAGIGNSEYPASGEVRIGKEVISFTRSGDNLTLTRGQFGTEAVAHDEDDLVQLCLRYVSQAPQDIVEDLLVNYAGVPASYIDKVQWDAEALDFLPRLYSAIITEPNGVSKLISEMAQQMYFTVWFDERTGKIILKAVRLAQEDEIFELDDEKHLIADSIAWKDLADELITQVWVYYGQIDPTDKLDQGSNYSTIAITADPSAEGPDKHNLRRIKTIFSRWIDATNASAAEDLGQRILNRYGNAPRQVTFRVDAKDDYLWLGNFIRLTNRLRVNQFGEVNAVNLQIFQAEESALGSEFKFTAQEFIPALIGDDQVTDPTVRTIPITSDLLNVNLRTLHDSLFGAPSGTETITFVVRQGVTIGGDALGGGTNVAFGQRVTTDDFYPGGASSRSPGFSDIGQMPTLQRLGLSSPRSVAAGSTVTGTEGRDSIVTDFRCDEVPVSWALRTGTWPAGVTVNLVVEAGAFVLGEGGAASSHPAADTVVEAIPGGDGGDALLIENAISITNGGVIASGGGGGACGFYYNVESTGFYQYYIAPGGGAAGFTFSRTKNCSLAEDLKGFTELGATIRRQPSAGSNTSGGAGGRIDFKDSFERDQTREGGDGANLNGTGENAITFGGNGGLPGKAVRSGANLITWVNKGDVRGDEVN